MFSFTSVDYNYQSLCLCFAKVRLLKIEILEQFIVDQIYKIIDHIQHPKF